MKRKGPRLKRSGRAREDPTLERIETKKQPSLQGIDGMRKGSRLKHTVERKEPTLKRSGKMRDRMRKDSRLKGAVKRK
jgi:hypothetical protein